MGRYVEFAPGAPSYALFDILRKSLRPAVRAVLKETLKSTITRQVGALLSRNAFSDFKKRLDHTEYGGAPLLGVKGVCIITHGSSNTNAIKNAIRVAAEFAEGQVNETIARELTGLHATAAVPLS